MDYQDRSAEDHLRELFEEGDSVAGLSSVHGALVAICSMGAGGTRYPAAPESRWYDDRRGKVRCHATTARALRSLSGAHVSTLWAYYGSPPWPGAAPDTLRADCGLAEDMRRRRWHRSVPPPEVVCALTAPLGRVALLTEALATATSLWEADGHGERPPHGVLVALCKAGGETVAPIEAEARARHAEALAAFCAAAGLRGPGAEPRERKPRREKWVEPRAFEVVRGVRA